MKSLSKFLYLLSPGFYLAAACIALIMIVAAIFLNTFEVM